MLGKDSGGIDRKFREKALRPRRTTVLTNSVRALSERNLHKPQNRLKRVSSQKPLNTNIIADTKKLLLQRKVEHKLDYMKTNRFIKPRPLFNSKASLVSSQVKKFQQSLSNSLAKITSYSKTRTPVRFYELIESSSSRLGRSIEKE